MIDLYDIIARALADGHMVKLEQGDIAVSISPAALEQKEEPKPEPIKPNMTVQEIAEGVAKSERMKRRRAINRKELDMGKVRALREAGWSLEKIADEMGCAAQTIANHLKEVEHE